MNKETLLVTLKNYKAENAQKYRITALGLFGSFARDESTSTSDVDVVVKIEIPDLYTIVHINTDFRTSFKRQSNIRIWRLFELELELSTTKP